MEKDAINKLIGNKIEMARNARGLTLKELAEKVGISESTAQRYEAGRIGNISISNLLKFAKALNVKPAHLLGWDCSSEFEPLAFDERKLLCDYRKLTAHGKEAIREQVEFRLSKEQRQSQEEVETS